MDYDEKLEELFIDLPEPGQTMGNVVHSVQVGKLMYISGVLPFSEGKITAKGRVGIEIRLDKAKLAARIAGINALAVISKELGTLNKIRKIVQITGFVASGGDFKDHFKVLDGTSELFSQIFGPASKHTRNAIGATCLPHDSCIELSLIVEIK